jgi:hypothetical protein
LSNVFFKSAMFFAAKNRGSQNLVLQICICVEMDSNLIITGAIAKNYAEYREKKNAESRVHQERFNPFSTNSLVGAANAALPQAGGLLLHLKEKTSNVASNVAGLHKRFATTKNRGTVNVRRQHATATRTLVPMRHGDVVYLSPVLNEEGCGMCMMSTTLVTQRTCVNFWHNEAARANPYAGLYIIRNVNYESKLEKEGAAGTNETIKQGEIVTFQLLLSQQFLCADVGNYADIERNFIKLGICKKDNDITAQFSIRTRYNCKPGNPIYYNDQVRLHR